MERSKMARIYTGYNYQLVPGDGDSGNHLFRIDKTTDGYSRLYTVVPIDYEAYKTMLNPNVSIRLRVTDERGNFFEKKFTLNILDVEEVPEKLKVDVVLIGAGGGAGGADDGNGGPGGSGSQFGFTTTLQLGTTYGLHIGSGGLGGVNAFYPYTTTGGPGAKPQGFREDFLVVKVVTVVLLDQVVAAEVVALPPYFPTIKEVVWVGVGNPWRRLLVVEEEQVEENCCIPRKGGDLEFLNTHVSLYGNHKTVGGIGFNYLFDGPGGGAGGGGAQGGQGASDKDGSYGGKSGITRTTFKPTSQSIVSGQTGLVVPGSFHLHGLAQRTETGSSAGKWWDGWIPPGAGSGGFSGTRKEERGNSNGQAGAAIIRYKDTYPRIKLGGVYNLSGGYHVHVFNGSASHSLNVELYG